jgi:hypothetical protein
MFVRRSLSLPIFPYDPNLERISRRSRSKRNSCLRAHSKSPMVEEPKPVLLRDHYVRSTYTPTYKRLDEFIEICSTIRLQNFSEDALRLRLFSFSLKEKAKYWLTSLELHYFLGLDATRVP